jgi:arylsulfate sulfotransferase
VWLWALACGDGNKTGDVGLSIELSQPTEVAPLVRRLHVEADEAVSLSVTWTSPDHQGQVEFPAGADVQDHLLLGMIPGATYEVQVTATAANGDTGVAQGSFTTADLPAYFPTGEILAGAGEREPGDTLLPMNTFINAGATELVTVWDSEGRLVYWLDVKEFIYDVEEYEGGLLVLLNDNRTRLQRYAWDGTALESWSIADDDVDHVVETDVAATFHHDLGASTAGFLGLGRRGAQVEGYPLDYVDPANTGPALIALESVVEIDATGAVTNELSFDDILPFSKIGYGSLEGTSNQGGQDPLDWTHANAVFEDIDGAWIISLRHLDVVMKVDPASHEIVWLLGDHANWPAELQSKLLTPVGDLDWQYHQHGPSVGPRGPNGEVELYLFDNGNFRASPYAGLQQPPNEETYSRVVQYEIDEDAMTVRQVFSFDDPSGGTLYSGAVGNATPLASGNVLSAWGFLTRMPDGSANEAAGLGTHTVRVIEIDPDAVAEVEQLYLSVPKAENASGWTGYRATRIPSLTGRVVD